MAKLRILTVFALIFGAFGASYADTLDMEGMAPDSDSARPTRGMTAASVESNRETNLRCNPPTIAPAKNATDTTHRKPFCWYAAGKYR